MVVTSSYMYKVFDLLFFVRYFYLSWKLQFSSWLVFVVIQHRENTINEELYNLHDVVLWQFDEKKVNLTNEILMQLGIKSTQKSNIMCVNVVPVLGREDYRSRYCVLMLYLFLVRRAIGAGTLC